MTGKEFRWAVISSHLTHAEIAKHLGVSSTTVGRWYKRDYLPDSVEAIMAELVRVADGTGLYWIKRKAKSERGRRQYDQRTRRIALR